MSAIPIPRPNKTERRMMRVRRFAPNSNTTDLFAVLRAERFTGSVTIHLNQGGINGLEAADSMPILDDRLGEATS